MRARKPTGRGKCIIGTDGGLTKSGTLDDVRYTDRDSLGADVEDLRAKVETDCLRSVYIEVTESITHYIWSSSLINTCTHPEQVKRARSVEDLNGWLKTTL